MYPVRTKEGLNETDKVSVAVRKQQKDNLSVGLAAQQRCLYWTLTNLRDVCVSKQIEWAHEDRAS
jgi:hypothetical protein